jgi:hypothetical protein
MSSALHCEPVLGQDLLACADPGRAIFDIDTHQQRVLRDMEESTPQIKACAYIGTSGSSATIIDL